MSLGSLARYDDAEDEIRDEDHNLVILPPSQPVVPMEIEQEPEHIMPLAENKPSPQPLDAKSKILVGYDDMSDDDDDDMSESDIDENEQAQEIILPARDSKGKAAVVNLGLFDGSSVLGSDGSDGSRLNDSFSERSPRDDGILLPPEPDGRCSKSLQEKITKMIEKKKNGRLNVNDYVQKKKDFRNPSIYEKLISFIGIDEHGTNYPKKLYDPSVWGPESFYDELAKKQRDYHKEKEREKLKNKPTAVEFVSGTKKPATSQPPSSSVSVSEKKSKWDQMVPPAPKPNNAPPKIPASLQAAIKSANK